VTLLEWHKALGRVCNGEQQDEFEYAVNVLVSRRDTSDLYFIGNGGSAAIASHMAIDFLNKGKFRARCFTDGAALTCLANDYSYKEVFLKQFQVCMRPHDVLVAISSSGESDNIVWCAQHAVDAKNVTVITLTGFEPDNRLRSFGTINFHVPSHNYGIVETVHLGILHALLEAVT
jgi:D-sedoheptulose 7-phosphate isomerase